MRLPALRSWERGPWAAVLAMCALPVLAAGCGKGAGTGGIECDPACPARWHCAESGCVPDDPNVPGTDLAVPDNPQGDCRTPCGGATPYCGPAHTCVACVADGDCPLGTVCVVNRATASCLPGCKDDRRCAGGGRCCDGTCTDTGSHPHHCGACGNACRPAHAGPSCVAGKCQQGPCDRNWADCNRDPQDGCEAYLGGDPEHCGTCGTRCAPAHAVGGCDIGGCYIRACEWGFDDCNTQVKDGCEARVSEDPANCGACGNACPAVSHAKVACSGGSCLIGSCDNGFGDCDGKLVNGCEITLVTDRNHCGACFSPCQQGQICVNGQCDCPPCSFPNARAACVNKQCAIDSCIPGYANCDGQQPNGCEQNINSDVRNCGACGKVCPQGLVCTNGGCTCPQCNIPNAKSLCVNNVCTLDACVQGYADCDKNAVNGCEINLETDATNCGQCGTVCGVQTPFCLGGVCSQISTSCKALHQGNPNLPDGVYTMDTDGAGPLVSFQAFCDMTTDNGGWTVCYQHNIVDIEEMNHSTVTNMGTRWGVPGAKSEFGSDCRTLGQALQPTAVRFTAADGVHWVQLNNPPAAVHEFFFAGNRGGNQMVNVTTWNSGNQSYNRLFCVHDCPGFGYNTNNINQIATGTNTGNCFEHNSKSSDSNHHWAMWGKCDGTYVEGPNQGAGGAQPDQPRNGWARVMLR